MKYIIFKNNKTIVPTCMIPFEIDYERLKKAANHFTKANGSHILVMMRELRGLL